MHSRDGASLSCESSKAYFCVLALVRGFDVRQYRVRPKHIAEIKMNIINTPITTYKIDQSIETFQ